jgi:hypothetical protein
MRKYLWVFAAPLVALSTTQAPTKPPPVKMEVPAQEHIKATPHRKPIKRAIGNKVEKVAPGKAQPKPKKEQGKSTGRPAGQPKIADSGPDLPYSCAMIRMYSAGKSRSELEAAGRASGLSEKQKRQAAACFK